MVVLGTAAVPYVPHFETNTGVKFVAVVDMRGRKLNGVEEGLADAIGTTKGKGKTTGATAGIVGLREGELKIVSCGLGIRLGLRQIMVLHLLTGSALGVQSYANCVCAAIAKSVL